ncbi:MAG: 30S ribosomal protein S18 [Phycisphaerales bacterium]|nr:30S ribosomal protein S18 [Phycisphaerales bacterium]
MARNVEQPPPLRTSKIAKKSAKGKMYVDYKDVDELRRLMSPNGKVYSRKRIGVGAREQRMIAQAIKRARYLGLLPYTDATL